MLVKLLGGTLVRIQLLFTSRRREDPYQQSAKLQVDIKLITLWILQDEVLLTTVTKKQEANAESRHCQVKINKKVKHTSSS